MLYYTVPKRNYRYQHPHSHSHPHQRSHSHLLLFKISTLSTFHSLLSSPLLSSPLLSSLPSTLYSTLLHPTPLDSTLLLYSLSSISALLILTGNFCTSFIHSLKPTYGMSWIQSILDHSFFTLLTWGTSMPETHSNTLIQFSA